MIRYRQIGYVELNVTDLVRSGMFYRKVVGLQPLTAGGNQAVFGCADQASSLLLHQQPVAGSGCLGLVLDSDAQFESLHRRLWNAGYAYRELSNQQCAARHLARATRMIEAYSGITLEFYLPAEGASQAFVPYDTSIRQISQLILATPRLDECLAFYRDVLTLPLQSCAAGPVRYLQPCPNRPRQLIGITFAEKPSIRQVGLMADAADSLGRALSRCRAFDVPLLPGNGLPLQADSLSFADPDGLVISIVSPAEPVASVEPAVATSLVAPAPVDTARVGVRRSTRSPVSG